MSIALKKVSSHVFFYYTGVAKRMIQSSVPNIRRTTTTDIVLYHKKYLNSEGESPPDQSSTIYTVRFDSNCVFVSI